MGIDLYWISERNEMRECVPDERDLVSEIVAAAPVGSVCLRFVDSYGDTVFNQLQIPVLIDELRTVDAGALGPQAHEHRERLVQLAVKARGQIHTYLKFYGD